MKKKEHPVQKNHVFDYEPITSSTECTGLIPAASQFDETDEAYQAIFPILLAKNPVAPKRTVCKTKQNIHSPQKAADNNMNSLTENAQAIEANTVRQSPSKEN